MKRKVGRWTAIQNKLPDTPEGNELWDWIEYRTYGKLGQSDIAIRLTKDQEAMVEEAESKLRPGEQHPG